MVIFSVLKNGESSPFFQFFRVKAFELFYLNLFQYVDDDQILNFFMAMQFFTIF